MVMTVRFMQGKVITDDTWEDGRFGTDDKYVARTDPALEQVLDEALRLQQLSIRLPKNLIEQLELIARFHGVPHQSLIRDVLTRFASDHKSG
jgi:hypothetical protein